MSNSASPLELPTIMLILFEQVPRLIIVVLFGSLRDLSIINLLLLLDFIENVNNKK